MPVTLLSRSRSLAVPLYASLDFSVADVFDRDRIRIRRPIVGATWITNEHNTGKEVS